GSGLHGRRPAGVSKSTTTAIWEARNAAAIAIGKMLGASREHRDRAMAGWQGIKALEELFGRDEAGEPFGGPLLDGMAGGTGALWCAGGVRNRGPPRPGGPPPPHPGGREVPHSNPLSLPPPHAGSLGPRPFLRRGSGGAML